MTNKIIWRLKEPPTPITLGQLVKDGLLSKDEAREILFNSETDEERDKKSLESEIKFLRELVEKLSNDKGRIVEIIREVEKLYKVYPWYQPYRSYCQSGISGITTSTYTDSNDRTAVSCQNFSDIKTF